MQPKARSIDGFVNRAGTPNAVNPATVVNPAAVQKNANPKPPRHNPLRPQLRPMPIPRAKKVRSEAPSAIPQQQPQRLTFDAPQALQPRRRWWQRLAFPAAVLMCLCASFLVQSLPLGMAAIAIYAVVAWIKKLPSRYSFVMAFLSLVTVMILLLVRQNVDLASNFSTYTFLLLVVGIVSVMQESKPYPKKTKQ